MNSDRKSVLKARVGAMLLALLLFCVSVIFANALTFPKYVTGAVEGNLIGEYYAEVDNGRSHDVLFIGDCEVYSSYVPAVLWEEFGITSYVRGSPAQTVVQSYHLLCEALEYETPSVVVFNVFALKHGREQNEAYTRMTIDGMRLSRHKMAAAILSDDAKNAASYIFPLLRFHSRWNELEREDFEYLFKRKRISHNGYLINTGIRPRADGAVTGGIADSGLPDGSFEILDKIRSVCNERRVRLILVKSPANSWKYWWYDEWDREVRDYAEQHEIDYFNFIGNEKIGIDWSQDTYDGGAHLNTNGAEKLTRYFGGILSERYGLADRRKDSKTCTVWRDKCVIYYKCKEGE